MLKSITISNYKMIQTDYELVMDKEDNFFVILGKENSGKTTFLEAIKLFKLIYEKGTRHATQLNEKPVFTFLFQISKKEYEYKVNINLEKLEVLSESLSEIYKNERYVYYERVNNQINLSTYLKNMFDLFDYQRLETYLYDLRFDKSHLILSNIYDKDFESKKRNIIKDIGEELIKITTFNKEEVIYDLHLKDERHYKRVMNALNQLNFNFERVVFESISFDELRKKMNRHQYDDFLDYIRIKMIEQAFDYSYAYAYNSIYKIAGIDTNELILKDTIIETKDYKISYKDLSHTEKTIMKLFMIAFQQAEGFYLFFDDLFDGVDELILMKVLDILNKEIGNNKIIFTTHQLGILNYKAYRHSQFKLIKNNKIYSLDELKVRTDKKLTKFYEEFMN